MHLRTRVSIIRGKGRDFELWWDDHFRNQTHFFKVQTMYFLDLRGVEMILQLFVFVIYRRILLFSVVNLFFVRPQTVIPFFCLIVPLS